MKRSLIAVVAMCGLAACGSSEEETAQPTTEDTVVATAPTTGTPTTAAPTTGTTAPTTGTTAPTPTTGATGQTITLSTGFAPNPTLATGTSGGAVEASTLSSDCAGWVSATPDHIVELGAAFPMLKIMALGTEAESDVTLVVHKPDGTYLCNDDSDGFHPVVEGEMPAGRYEVFVGSYQQGQRQAYRLGITTTADATPTSALAQAAQ